MWAIPHLLFSYFIFFLPLSHQEQDNNIAIYPVLEGKTMSDVVDGRHILDKLYITNDAIRRIDERLVVLKKMTEYSTESDEYVTVNGKQEKKTIRENLKVGEYKELTLKNVKERRDNGTMVDVIREGETTPLQSPTLNYGQFLYWVADKTDTYKIKLKDIIYEGTLENNVLTLNSADSDGKYTVFWRKFTQLASLDQPKNLYFTQWKYIKTEGQEPNLRQLDGIEELTLRFQDENNINKVITKLNRLKSDIESTEKTIKDLLGQNESVISDTSGASKIRDEYLKTANTSLDLRTEEDWNILRMIQDTDKEIHKVDTKILNREKRDRHELSTNVQFNDEYGLEASASGLTKSADGILENQWRKNRFVPTEDHHQWFGNRIASPNRIVSGLNNSEDQGFDKKEDWKIAYDFFEHNSNINHFYYPVDHLCSNDDYICAISGNEAWYSPDGLKNWKKVNHHIPTMPFLRDYRWSNFQLNSHNDLMYIDRSNASAKKFVIVKNILAKTPEVERHGLTWNGVTYDCDHVTVRHGTDEIHLDGSTSANHLFFNYRLNEFTRALNQVNESTTLKYIIRYSPDNTTMYHYRVKINHNDTLSSIRVNGLPITWTAAAAGADVYTLVDMCASDSQLFVYVIFNDINRSRYLYILNRVKGEATLFESADQNHRILLPVTGRSNHEVNNIVYYKDRYIVSQRFIYDNKDKVIIDLTDNAFSNGHNMEVFKNKIFYTRQYQELAKNEKIDFEDFLFYQEETLVDTKLSNIFYNNEKQPNFTHRVGDHRFRDNTRYVSINNKIYKYTKTDSDYNFTIVFENPTEQFIEHFNFIDSRTFVYAEKDIDGITTYAIHFYSLYNYKEIATFRQQKLSHVLINSNSETYGITQDSRFYRYDVKGTKTEYAIDKDHRTELKFGAMISDRILVINHNITGSNANTTTGVHTWYGRIDDEARRVVYDAHIVASSGSINSVLENEDLRDIGIFFLKSSKLDGGHLRYFFDGIHNRNGWSSNSTALAGLKKDISSTKAQSYRIRVTRNFLPSGENGIIISQIVSAEHKYASGSDIDRIYFHNRLVTDVDQSSWILDGFSPQYNGSGNPDPKEYIIATRTLNSVIQYKVYSALNTDPTFSTTDFLGLDKTSTIPTLLPDTSLRTANDHKISEFYPFPTGLIIKMEKTNSSSTTKYWFISKTGNSSSLNSAVEITITNKGTNDTIRSFFYDIVSKKIKVAVLRKTTNVNGDTYSIRISECSNTNGRLSIDLNTTVSEDSVSSSFGNNSFHYITSDSTFNFFISIRKTATRSRNTQIPTNNSHYFSLRDDNLLSLKTDIEGLGGGLEVCHKIIYNLYTHSSENASDHGNNFISLIKSNNRLSDKYRLKLTDTSLETVPSTTPLTEGNIQISDIIYDDNGNYYIAVQEFANAEDRKDIRFGLFKMTALNDILAFEPLWIGLLNISTKMSLQLNQDHLYQVCYIDETVLGEQNETVPQENVHGYINNFGLKDILYTVTNDQSTTYINEIDLKTKERRRVYSGKSEIPIKNDYTNDIFIIGRKGDSQTAEKDRIRMIETNAIALELKSPVKIDRISQSINKTKVTHVNFNRKDWKNIDLKTPIYPVFVSDDKNGGKIVAARSGVYHTKDKFKTFEKLLDVNNIDLRTNYWAFMRYDRFILLYSANRIYVYDRTTSRLETIYSLGASNDRHQEALALGQITKDNEFVFHGTGASDGDVKIVAVQLNPNGFTTDSDSQSNIVDPSLERTLKAHKYIWNSAISYISKHTVVIKTPTETYFLRSHAAIPNPDNGTRERGIVFFNNKRIIWNINETGFSSVSRLNDDVRLDWSMYNDGQIIISIRNYVNKITRYSTLIVYFDGTNVHTINRDPTYATDFVEAAFLFQNDLYVLSLNGGLKRRLGHNRYQVISSEKTMSNIINNERHKLGGTTEPSRHYFYHNYKFQQISDRHVSLIVNYGYDSNSGVTVPKIGTDSPTYRRSVHILDMSQTPVTSTEISGFNETKFVFYDFFRNSSKSGHHGDIYRYQRPVYCEYDEDYTTIVQRNYHNEILDLRKTFYERQSDLLISDNNKPKFLSIHNQEDYSLKLDDSVNQKKRSRFINLDSPLYDIVTFNEDKGFMFATTKGRNRHPKFLNDTSSFIDELHIRAFDGSPLNFYKEMGKIFEPKKLTGTELSVYFNNMNDIVLDIDTDEIKNEEDLFNSSIIMVRRRGESASPAPSPIHMQTLSLNETIYQTIAPFNDMGLEIDDPNNRITEITSEDIIRNAQTHEYSLNDGDSYKQILSHYTFNTFTFVLEQIIKTKINDQEITYGSLTGKQVPSIYCDKKAIEELIEDLNQPLIVEISKEYFKNLELRISPSINHEVGDDHSLIIVKDILKNQDIITTHLNLGMEKIKSTLKNRPKSADDEYTYNEYQSITGYVFSSSLFTQTQNDHFKDSALQTLPNLRDKKRTFLLGSSSDHLNDPDDVKTRDEKFFVNVYDFDAGELKLTTFDKLTEYGSEFYDKSQVMIMGLVDPESRPIINSSSRATTHTFEGSNKKLIYQITEVRDIKNNIIAKTQWESGENRVALSEVALSKTANFLSGSQIETHGEPVKLQLRAFCIIKVKVLYKIGSVIKYEKDIVIQSINKPDKIDDFKQLRVTSNEVTLIWKLKPEHNYGLKVIKDNVDYKDNIGLVQRFTDKEGLTKGSTYRYKIVPLMRRNSGMIVEGKMSSEISVTIP